MNTHMCVCVCVCVYIYIYIERERERELVSRIQCPLLPQLTDPKVFQYYDILNLNLTFCGLY